MDISRDVWALSLARLGDAVGNSLLFIALPLYVTRIRATALPFSETIRVGLLLSAYGFVSAAAEPYSGIFIDRLGHFKRMVQLGLLVMAGSLLGYILADRYVSLLVLRAVQGIGVAITVPAALALIRSATRTPTRGRSMGVYTALRMLGIGLGPLVGGLLLQRAGFTATFIAGACCIALAVLFVELWVREPNASPSQPTQDHAKERPAVKGFFSRSIWSAGIVGPSVAIFTMICSFTLIATLEQQFNRKLGIGAFLFAVAFSSFTFSRLIVQVPAGSLSDRFGRKPLIICGLLLLAPLTALQGWVSSFGELLTLRVLQGGASAAVIAPALALAADAAGPGGQGRQLSITTMGFSLGMAVGPLIAGFLVTYFFALPFVVAAGLCLAGVWVVHRYTPETVKASHGPPCR